MYNLDLNQKDDKDVNVTIAIADYGSSSYDLMDDLLVFDYGSTSCEDAITLFHNYSKS